MFFVEPWVSGKDFCFEFDSMDNGAKLHQWDYTGNNPAQQWDLVDAGNGWYNLRNVRSGLSLDNLNSTADGGTVTQWTPNTSTAQKWRLQPWGKYFIRTDSGKYIRVQKTTSANGSPIVQSDQQNSPLYKWQFMSKGDGLLGVFSLSAPGRVISVRNASSAPAYSTQLWDYNPNNIGDQKVRLVPRANGKFKFFFKHDGMSWDIPGGSAANNVKLQQYPDNTSEWQTFSLERDQ